MEERKSASKSASSVFYEAYNDIDIYVEDSQPGYKKIFKELLNRALGGKFRIEQIFPIGNRLEVISQCEKDQNNSGRKRVYVVDGDLYLLNDDLRNDLKGLYVLPRYCVENYFIDSNALVDTAYEEDPEMEIEQIKTKLDFDKWVEENEPKLLELFIIYAICFKYKCSEQLVSYRASKLCFDNTGVVCHTKTKNRREELIKILEDLIGEHQLQAEIAAIKERIKLHEKKLIKYVSGKDYLYPLLVARLQSFLKFTSSGTTIKIRLARRVDVKDLESIEKYIYQ